jgi:hypothetical protein
VVDVEFLPSPPPNPLPIAISGDDSFKGGKKRVNKKEFIGHSGNATKQAQDGIYELDTTVAVE